MKVCLAGLISFNNYGDQFIVKTLEYLVKKVDNNAEICFLDFISLYDTNIKNVGCKIPTKLGGRWITEFELMNFGEKYYYNKLKQIKPDCIIFVGGSFKYTTQDVDRNYSAIVYACKKLNIPVMFDAMNIQKYDDTSVRCKRLKKFANYENVKIISSRDGEYGVNRLNKDYIYNKKIKILPVGDPALWIPECYKINKSDNNNIVGINIIREGIFKDYSGDISENRVIKFYCELINAFENKNIPYKLFTNGMTDDYKTACNILRKLDKNDKVSEIIVPKNDLDNVKIISNFNKIVGARLHACICAYALDIPVVGFIWDEKLKHFALCNKIEDNFVSDKEFIADIVVNKLETTDENCYNNKIRNNWKQLTLDSIRQFFDII